MADETTPAEEGVEMPIEGEKDVAAELQADLAKTKDALLRTAADFDNFRKRQRREMDDLKKYAAEKVLLELLPALDNLQRAVAAAGQGSESDGLVKGVKMVCDQFKAALENQGLKGFDSVGQKFDPTRHEAISEREQEGATPGFVVEEFQRGYMLHDRVARPAMVVVASGSSGGEKPSDAKDESLN